MFFGFHTLVVLCLVAAVGIVMTSVDPIKVTEYSLIFSAVALPLTYLPILIVANDRDYLGEHVNGRISNILGTGLLLVVLAASLATIPLMIIARTGQ